MSIGVPVKLECCDLLEVVLGIPEGLIGGLEMQGVLAVVLGMLEVLTGVLVKVRKVHGL